jgi:CHAT domain-containing protein/tetratricopeptide (TPR) repeat protein
VIALSLSLSETAAAQVRGDVTPLGQGAKSGAVCLAVRDYDDPMAQQPGGRVWSIRCRGWDAPIGRLYMTPSAEAVAVWLKTLAGRAACRAPTAEALLGLTTMQRSPCTLTGSNTPFLRYVGRRGRFTVGAEGYAAAADVLETGLQVVSGVVPPPKAVQTMSAASAEVAADFGGALGGLASAEAVATDPHRLLARGYVGNNEWRFDQAATDFRIAADDARAQNAPPKEQAEALLNLALNVSNAGRFAEADGLFDRADVEVAAAQDVVLRAEALDDRAFHLRNQGRFGEAAAMADQALSLRASALQPLTAATGQVSLIKRDGDLVIDPSLADRLNVRTNGRDLVGGEAVAPEMRLEIQQIAALEIMGSSKAAMGDAAGGSAALSQALSLLTSAESSGVLNVALHALILADLADLDLDETRPAAAVEHYRQALAVLRTRHAGTSTEAGLLLRLGRAQIAAGRNDEALETYGRAFDLFKASRGSLGSSADAAEPYFDLLLTLSARDPDRAQAYASRFFTAAEMVVSDATASTIARLAARVASGDDATAGLVRAVDDLRRQVAAAESQIAALQAQNAYTGATKARADDALTSLEAQLAGVDAKLLTVNPRYDQLVASNVALSDLQKSLRPDEVYVKTLLLGGRGYGLLVSRSRAKAYAIPLSRDQGARAAAALRAPFEAEDGLPPFDVAGSHRMFDQIFGPVEPDLLAARHLIYEPDPVLVSVPAALFVTDQASVKLMAGRSALDYRGVAWLGAKLDSSLVLSASSFLQSRAFRPSHAKQIFLGFGDPDLSPTNPHAFTSVLRRGGGGETSVSACVSTRQALLGLPALPDTADEVKSIAATLGGAPKDVVLGQAFSDDTLRRRSDLSDFRVLYFATHAILPMPDACLPEPALVTSVGGRNSDGLLVASDILSLKLDADLVVLSACDTGGAGDAAAADTGLVGGGGALGGLARAAIYAGARALIVSHWSVDSEATVRLMTDMFKSGAASEAEGLQRAQAAMQADAHLSHPYYWAPFTVVGDGARPIPGVKTTLVQADLAHP